MVFILKSVCGWLGGTYDISVCTSIELLGARPLRLGHLDKAPAAK